MSDDNAPHVPAEVRALAMQLGARMNQDQSKVALTQHGVMRDRPTGRWKRFTAHQRILLQRIDFEWRALTGPFACISVVDALTQTVPNLEVKLFRYIKLAHLTATAAVTKGQMMRYLAELAWAPDAILTNHTLEWTILSEKTIRVGAVMGTVHAEVEFALGSDGRIAIVSAPDRPRWEDGGFVERPWQGRFSDYHLHQGRWLPFYGEVGWTLEGEAFTTWKGEIDSWIVL